MLTLTTPLALAFSPTFSPTYQFWWNFTQSDCAYDDVTPQPACARQHKGDIEALKLCCLATSGCGGFNTNGIIKKSDCLQKKKNEPACDLYVLQTKPQPPPPPPSENWPPIWPLPKQYSTGGKDAAALPLAAGFKIELAGGKSSPLLAAAIMRYEKLMFAHATAKSTAAAAAGELATLTLTVESLDESHPQLETDESYTLDVAAPAASLGAKSVYGALRVGGVPRGRGYAHARTLWPRPSAKRTRTARARRARHAHGGEAGALRGLETLSQLVRFDFAQGSYYVPGAPWRVRARRKWRARSRQPPPRRPPAWCLP